MTALFDLAVELLQAIWTEAGKQCMKDHRVACKQLDAVIKPLLFANISIFLTAEEHLAALASRKAPACKLAQQLTIFCFDLHNLASWPMYDEVVPLLSPALSACTNVRRVCWYADRFPAATPEAIWAGLASMTRLECLLLRCCNPALFSLGKRLPHLRGSGLRQFTLSMRTLASSIVPEIAAFVANSPLLELLEIDFPPATDGDTSATPTLNDILASVPQSTLLKLRTLRLTGCLIIPNSSTLRHLTSLEELRWNPHPPSSFPEGQYDTAMEDIWSALAEAGVQPTKFGTNAAVCPALFAYLASYSGLRELCLRPGPKADGLAEAFYSSVVPSHATTLVVLDVQPTQAGRWCLGKGLTNTLVAPGLRRCERLTDLSMAVGNSDSSFAEIVDGLAVDQLSLRVVPSESFWRSQHSYMSISYHQHARLSLEVALADYRALGPATPPRTVRIVDRVFHLRKNGRYERDVIGCRPIYYTTW